VRKNAGDRHKQKKGPVAGACVAVDVEDWRPENRTPKDYFFFFGAAFFFAAAFLVAFFIV
jgi:hypothetical protein